MNNLISNAGMELANLLVASDPLSQAWDAIQYQKLHTAPNLSAEIALSIYETERSDCTIVSFLTSGPLPVHGQEKMISSSSLPGSFRIFDFLCSKKNESFSINEVAINLFALHYTELDLLRTKLVENSKVENSNTPLILITGHSFGGCVATLFTLWLLESLDLWKAKRPLCITFGSPLVGDEDLRKCVLQFSTWTSCFLNVASIQDPVPKVFLSQAPLGLGTVSQASNYKPFGTFLVCSNSGCTCFEDPDTILQLLVETNSPSTIQFGGYGQVLKDLKLKALSKHAFELAERDRVPLKAGIKTQLASIFGVLQSQSLQQQQPSINFDTLRKKMETHERVLAIQKAKVSNSSKKLNDIKRYMTYMEWYKKESKGMGIGYYDRYKNKRYTSDINVEEFKKKLSNYWEDKIEEVWNKPHKENAFLRTSFLFGGNTYRRMMEPLHIAEYYKDNGGKDYRNERPRHFILLEKWCNEEDRKEAEGKKKVADKAKSVSFSLNDDSCFWAHVEEALILCNEPTITQDARQKLIEFEGYVLDALKNFAVSPDIFLKQSTFMTWWKQYDKIMGIYYSSQLTEIMRRRTFRDYENGVQLVA